MMVSNDIRTRIVQSYVNFNHAWCTLINGIFNYQNVHKKIEHKKISRVGLKLKSVKQPY